MSEVKKEMNVRGRPPIEKDAEALEALRILKKKGYTANEVQRTYDKLARREAR